jgi:hypothetical protein
MTIGGNDAGFARIFRNCIMHWLSTNTVLGCEEALIEWATATVRNNGSYAQRNPNQGGLPSIAGKLTTVLNDIRTAAPNAQILVPLYPSLLNVLAPGSIYLNYGFYLDNSPLRGVVLPLEQYDRSLDETIQRTVEAWRQRSARVDVRVIVGTQLAFFPTRVRAGHQLGDPVPWVNPIVFPDPRESAHPTCLGQIALAETVLREINRPFANNWRC